MHEKGKLITERKKRAAAVSIAVAVLASVLLIPGYGKLSVCAAAPTPAAASAPAVPVPSTPTPDTPAAPTPAAPTPNTPAIPTPNTPDVPVPSTPAAPAVPAAQSSAAPETGAPAQQASSTEEKPQVLATLPVIRITTKDGVLPTCDIIYPPEEGLPGASITNDEYVKGSVSVTGLGGQIKDAAMKIKVRGNTSAVGSGKKSYKIKLEEAADMMGRGAGHADREWLLLKSGDNLKTWLGLEVSKKLGMYWTPALRFVDVEMNGKPMGIYALTESVEAGPARKILQASGYLFEEDAYWWNEDGDYFKTSVQPRFFGYTWKYPEDTKIGSSKISTLKNRMQTVDAYLASGDKRVWNYIDADSFASWLLVRDILGQGDPVGSNIYFFMRSSGAKVEMGPMWDFDSAFEFTEHWSAQHDADFLPFAKLFNDPVFVKAYTDKWISVVKNLEMSITGSLSTLGEAQGKALDDARARNNNVWSRNGKSFTAESADVRAYLRKQLPWINARVAEMTGAAANTGN